MKLRIWVALLGMVALAGTALTHTAVAQGDVIAERRAALKRMGGHMEAFKPVADARGDVRALAPRIDEMIAWFRTMPAHFPAGTGTGDTRALPAIWTDFAEFERVNARLLGQLDVLKAAAASGDAEAFATAYQATGSQYCGACHRPFRRR
jgi:cytochrome c556